MTERKSHPGIATNVSIGLATKNLPQEGGIQEFVRRARRLANENGGLRVDAYDTSNAPWRFGTRTAMGFVTHPDIGILSARYRRPDGTSIGVSVEGIGDRKGMAEALGFDPKRARRTNGISHALAEVKMYRQNPTNGK